VAETMGIDVPLKQNFHCILPGHEECNPSAALCSNWRGFIVYFDNHVKDRRLVYTLSEVRASLAYGKPTRLNPPEAATWGIRGLVEAGVMQPVRIDAPKLGDAPMTVRRVYEGFLLLLACKWHVDDGAPTTFNRKFAAAWCGVTEKQARSATTVLIDHRFIEMSGAIGRVSCIFRRFVRELCARILSHSHGKSTSEWNSLSANCGRSAWRMVGLQRHPRESSSMSCADQL
jgi:hypothetical protein